MPFNRLQGLQRSCDIPLAASTQWDIVAAAAIVLGTTVIAALYPAVKAARIRPLEALHYI